MFFHQKVELTKEVSERTRAEEALMETNQALAALIESAPLAIVSITAEQKVKTWNPAAERMFGWREEEVLGWPLPFVPADKQRDVQDMIEPGACRETALLILKFAVIKKTAHQLI